jgi:hypothetical protein
MGEKWGVYLEFLSVLGGDSKGLSGIAQGTVIAVALLLDLLLYQQSAGGFMLLPCLRLSSLVFLPEKELC